VLEGSNYLLCERIHVQSLHCRERPRHCHLLHQHLAHDGNGKSSLVRVSPRGFCSSISTEAWGLAAKIAFFKPSARVLNAWQTLLLTIFTPPLPPSVVGAFSALFAGTFFSAAGFFAGAFFAAAAFFTGALAIVK
jgi:hypothetical protein